MAALFPRGAPLVPVGAGLTAALLIGACGNLLRLTARPPVIATEAALPDAGPPSRRVRLITRAAIPAVALAVVICLRLAPSAQVVPALALVSGLHCLALALLSRVGLGALVGVALGGLALATMLLIPDQADIRAAAGLGSAVALWSGALIQLRHGAALAARARPR
jgi:hypothetical protein